MWSITMTIDRRFPSTSSFSPSACTAVKIDERFVSVGGTSPAPAGLLWQLIGLPFEIDAVPAVESRAVDDDTVGGRREELEEIRYRHPAQRQASRSLTDVGAGPRPVLRQRTIGHLEPWTKCAVTLRHDQGIHGQLSDLGMNRELEALGQQRAHHRQQLAEWRYGRLGFREDVEAIVFSHPGPLTI